MMNTCELCRYWVKSDDWDCPPTFKKCGKAPMASDMTDWDYDSEENVIKDEFKGVLMCAMDGSTYRADIFTAPNFYCPMFEEKEE